MILRECDLSCIIWSSHITPDRQGRRVWVRGYLFKLSCINFCIVMCFSAVMWYFLQHEYHAHNVWCRHRSKETSKYSIMFTILWRFTFYYRLINLSLIHKGLYPWVFMVVDAKAKEILMNCAKVLLCINLLRFGVFCEVVASAVIFQWVLSAIKHDILYIWDIYESMSYHPV